MERAQCIEMIYPELEDKLVVTIMGACAQELYDLGHRENFFYLQHAMGLASSIGLGLARALPAETVVVLDGDGSALMNLGTFATLARYRPTNLIHIVFDNGSLLSTGGFDSHTTSGVTDLAAVAKAAGIEHVVSVDDPFSFGEAILEALERDDLTVIVAHVKAVGPDDYGMSFSLPENAERFRQYIEGRKRDGVASTPGESVAQAPTGDRRTATPTFPVVAKQQRSERSDPLPKSEPGRYR